MFRKMKDNMMVFMSKRMIACDEASFLISYRLDNKLGLKKWMQLKMHLISCHFCRKYASQLKDLNKAVDQYREEASSEESHHHLPEDFRAKMETVIVRELNAK